MGTLLKARVGSQSGTPDHKPGEPRPGTSNEPQYDGPGLEEEQPQEDGVVSEEMDGQDDRQRLNMTKKSDLNTKMGSHIDKLDSLINKAENAQYSMKHQTKQMKNYMK